MIYTLLLQKRKVCMMLILCIHISFMVQGQTQISGKVITADDQQAVIGASVKIKGSVNGTVTGMDGTFSITAAPRDILVISYLGYQTREITVGSQTSLRLKSI